MRFWGRVSAGAYFLAFVMLSLSVAVIDREAWAVQRANPEWFAGLSQSEACAVLPGDANFIEKNLTTAAGTQRRVAFVAGNTAYTGPLDPLRSPVNDAVGLARQLQSLGFEVFLSLNSTAADLDSCAQQAAQAPSDLAVVYFSGHGIQIDAKNYLVAVDARAITADLAGFVSLDGITDRFAGQTDALIVLLDACRNNPLTGDSLAGLAAEKPAKAGPQGAGGQGGKGFVPGVAGAGRGEAERFYAFATSPNATALDGTGDFSPFTEALLAALPNAGWPISRVMAEASKTVGEKTDWSQTPWTRSSLTEQIFFNGAVDPDAALKASQLKAEASEAALAKGDRRQAMALALQGLPANFTDQDIAKYPEAYEALYFAVRSRSVRLPTQGALHASFNKQGTVVATVSAEVGGSSRKEALKIWDVETESLIAELLPVELSGTVASTLGPAQFSADGNKIFGVHGGTGRLSSWDTQTGRLSKTLTNELRWSDIILPPKITVSSSGRWIMTIDEQAGLVVIDATTGAKQFTMSVPTVMAAAITADGEMLIVGYATGSEGGGEYQAVRIQGYDLASKKQVFSRDIKEPSWGVYSGVASPEGRYVAFTTSTDALLILDIQTKAVTRIQAPRVGTSGLSFSPDERFVAVVSDDWSSNQPIAIEIATGQRVTLPYDQRPIIDIVHNLEGEEVGPPWLPDAGDLWRKGVTGPALYGAARARLGAELTAKAEAERVKFR